MNEWEAWWAAAQAFSIPRVERTRYGGRFCRSTYDGLCLFFQTLQEDKEITRVLEIKITDKIDLRLWELDQEYTEGNGEEPREDQRHYLAPKTDEGDEVRVAFCLRQMRLLGEGDEARP